MLLVRDRQMGSVIIHLQSTASQVLRKGCRYNEWRKEIRWRKASHNLTRGEKHVSSNFKCRRSHWSNWKQVSRFINFDSNTTITSERYEEEQTDTVIKLKKKSYLLKQGTTWNQLKPPETSWNYRKPLENSHIIVFFT